MSTKIELVTPQPEEKVETSSTSIFDDLATLRKQSKVTVQRKTVLVNVPVDKPANNVYFRSHPDPEMMLDEQSVVRDTTSTSKPYYFIVPAMRMHPKLVRRLRMVTIGLLYIWPGGTLQLWPVPIVTGKSLSSFKSARSAFEQSQTIWTQIVWNEERQDYDVETAEAINVEPVWPEKSMSELLKTAFADRIIDNEDCDYVKQLRGVVD
jgi:hypothetical protein